MHSFLFCFVLGVGFFLFFVFLFGGGGVVKSKKIEALVTAGECCWMRKIIAYCFALHSCAVTMEIACFYLYGKQHGNDILTIQHLV